MMPEKIVESERRVIEMKTAKRIMAVCNSPLQPVKNIPVIERRSDLFRRGSALFSPFD